MFVAAKQIIDAAKSTPLKVIRDIGFSFASFLSLSTTYISLSLSLSLSRNSDAGVVRFSGDIQSSGDLWRFGAGSPLLSPNQIISLSLINRPAATFVFPATTFALRRQSSPTGIVLSPLPKSDHISLSLINRPAASFTVFRRRSFFRRRHFLSDANHLPQVSFSLSLSLSLSLSRSLINLSLFV